MNLSSSVFSGSGIFSTFSETGRGVGAGAACEEEPD